MKSTCNFTIINTTELRLKSVQNEGSYVNPLESSLLDLHKHPPLSPGNDVPTYNFWFLSSSGYDWLAPRDFLFCCYCTSIQNFLSLSIQKSWIWIDVLSLIPPKLHRFILKISFQLKFGYSPCTRISPKHPWPIIGEFVGSTPTGRTSMGPSNKSIGIGFRSMESHHLCIMNWCGTFVSWQMNSKN